MNNFLEHLDRRSLPEEPPVLENGKFVKLFHSSQEDFAAQIKDLSGRLLLLILALLCGKPRSVFEKPFLPARPTRKVHSKME